MVLRAGPTRASHYTRNGAFTTDAKGQLVTAAHGERCSIRRAADHRSGRAAASDRPQGKVHVDGRQVAKLAVTALDPKPLRKPGDNLSRAPSQANAQAAPVEQGCLEQSNVNRVTEMVDLIETMRSFEAGQKVIQALDDTLGKAVNEVGRV